MLLRNELIYFVEGRIDYTSTWSCWKESKDRDVVEAEFRRLTDRFPDNEWQFGARRHAVRLLDAHYILGEVY